MHFLLDTNILIPVEPTSLGGVEPTTPLAVDLLRLAHEGHHRVSIHPASLVDLERDKDDQRRKVRLTLLGKYARLDQPPPDTCLPDAIQRAAHGTNHWADNQLLAAVVADAVDYLVTEDDGLLRKAERIGLGDRVIPVADAVALLGTLLKRVPTAPPTVEHMPAHALDLTDPIFVSLRGEYPPTTSSTGFDDWIRKCRRENRDTWVIRGVGSTYGGLALVKPEPSEALGLVGATVLKLCTFKVATEHRGRRFGELLLKTLFEFCAKNRFTHMYVTAYETHEELLALFDEFGFDLQDRRTPRNELLLVKTFVPASDADTLDRLEYHRRFGPPAVRLEPEHSYLVPIKPEYHKMLFPDAEPEEPQARLFPEPVAPYGNAIRKAYLSNAPTRRIQPGDVLAFYRSSDLQAVTVIGIVERTVVSKDPTVIAKEVGRRTVYSLDQIEQMSNKREVLALLFRQDRILSAHIERWELEDRGVMNGPPQTVQSVRPEGIEWLRARIEE